MEVVVVVGMWGVSVVGNGIGDVVNVGVVGDGVVGDGFGESGTAS